MIRCFLALTFLGVLVGCQSKPQPITTVTAPPRLSILQGATDTTSTTINILAPLESQYTLTILLDSTVLHTPPLKEKTYSGSDWKMLTVELKGLNPGSVYDLKVSDNDGRIIDTRTFKTLKTKLTSPSIAITSCLDDQFSDLQKKQWQELWFQKPDMIFLIGDNVYADRGTSSVDDQSLWKRYTETRQKLELYHMKSLIPVFATWDDHDYGMKDGNLNFEHKAKSLEIFRTFFPIYENKNIQLGPGASSLFQLGTQTFIFLDDRSFRTPKESTHEESHWGQEQEQWLFAALKKRKGPFWLMNGDQYFGGYHTFESYQGNHPQSFKKMMARLKQTKKTIIFISGDRHLAEVIAVPKIFLGYETFEFTSSGLHAKMFPGSSLQFKNPHQDYILDGTPHFLILQSLESKTRKLKLNATYYGQQSQVLHRKTYEVKR